MHVADTILGQKIVAIRIRSLAAFTGIAGIPIEQQVRRLDRLQRPRSFGAGAGIARHLIFQHQRDALLAGFAGGIEQFGVNVFAIWRLIVKPPEIKTAYAVSLESPCQLDAALQNFILLIKGEAGVELIALGAVLCLASRLPVDL